MFILAILTGLIFGGIPYYTEYIGISALMVVMTLTTMDIELKKAFRVKKYFNKYIVNLLLSYLFLGGIIIILSTILVSDSYLRAGFIIMAAIPPAVAVIPFTGILKGDLDLAVGSSAFLYIASLGLAPLIIFLFMAESINIFKLLEQLILMIVVPLIISRGLLYLKADKTLGDSKGILINIGFFVLIFTVVGVNRNAFLLDLNTMVIISFICLIRTFVCGTGIYYTTLKLNIEKPIRIDYMLFGSFKNLGLTIIIAFLLFGEKAAVPAAICMPFEILTLPYYKKIVG